jgi:hypothetical protein
MSSTPLPVSPPAFPGPLELRPDERMAKLALAFEMELAEPGQQEDKWPIGYGIGFAIICSAALWAAFAAVVALLMRL